MRRHKAATMQINVRLDTTVVDQLEAHAKAHRVSFAEEVRQRLFSSLVAKRELSLSEFRSDWLRRVRDTIEGEARKTTEAAKKIEDDWRFLQSFDAKWTVFCGDVDRELDPYVKIPKIRELLTGAPTLPDETKSKTAQQE
jgi:hypothetical protein